MASAETRSASGGKLILTCLKNRKVIIRVLTNTSILFEKMTRVLAKTIPSIFFMLLFLTTGCAATSEPAKLTDIRSIVSKGDLDDLSDYLEKLSLESRIEVARLAVADGDKRLNMIGIQVLVESGLLNEAVPALSNRVLEGDDLTAFGYAWTHSDDPQLSVHMYLKISRYLLAKFDSFDAGQKKKTERFIVSSLGRANYLKKFSVEAAEQHLSQMEARFLQSEKQK